MDTAEIRGQIFISHLLIWKDLQDVTQQAFGLFNGLCSYPFLSGVEGMHDEGRYASPHGMNHLGFISIQPHPDDHGPITFA